MNDFIQIYTTTANKEDAEIISKNLLENRLAGCVQIVGPIKSQYWWENEIEDAEEWLCIIKSKKSFFKTIEKLFEKIHPYDTPELIVTPIIEGSVSYLNWLNHELKSDNQN